MLFFCKVFHFDFAFAFFIISSFMLCYHCSNKQERNTKIKRKQQTKKRNTARKERKRSQERSKERKEERQTENIKSKRKRVNRGGGKTLRRKQGRHSATSKNIFFKENSFCLLKKGTERNTNTKKTKITNKTKEGLGPSEVALRATSPDP